MSEKAKNAVHNNAFRLYGPRDPNDKSKRPDSLNISMFANNLSLSCFSERGNVFFNLDVAQATDLVDRIQEAAKSQGPRQFRWENRAYNKDTRKKDVRGTIIVGKSDSNECYIAVTTPNWDKPIKFSFRPSFDFRPMDSNGNYIDEKEYSAIIANNYARALYDTYIVCLANDYTHPEPRGNGGGYNRSSSGGGNYNNRNGNNHGGNSGGGNAGGGASNDDWGDIDII